MNTPACNGSDPNLEKSVLGFQMFGKSYAFPDTLCYKAATR